MQTNGFFQLQMQQTGIYLVVFPPQEGGVSANITEILAYLDKYKYNHYDIKQLDLAVKSVKQPMPVRVADFKGDSVDEQLDIDISSDRLKVTGRFYPPSNNGRRLTLESIISSLQKAGIKTGINKAALESFLNDRRYCEDFDIAQGKKPTPGTEARIEYYFNTNHNLRPKHNEDGSVDYKSIDVISHVEAGDLLARLYKEKQGTVGTDVFGNEVRPPQMKPKHLAYGNNIDISEDGTEIFSKVTGHVTLVKEKVFVSDIYEVPADVDNSTGNITYDGSLHIKGNVKGGFEVHAKGDITIEGVVEDAVVEAGGQIIVKRGIHGMGKGVLKAGSNIITKFIENSTVKSGGYIETDLIMHSNVSAETTITVAGKKGFISGGVIRAGELIEAQTIGSEMGTLTQVEVGTPPETKERMMALSKEIEKQMSELEQIKPILATFSSKLAKGVKLPPEKIAYVKKTAANFQTIQKSVAEKQAELEQLKQEVREGDSAKIVVNRDVFPGVSVMISDSKLNVKNKRSCCEFVKRQGDVSAQNL